jgi:hypothetical protein
MPTLTKNLRTVPSLKDLDRFDAIDPQPECRAETSRAGAAAANEHVHTLNRIVL